MHYGRFVPRANKILTFSPGSIEHSKESGDVGRRLALVCRKRGAARLVEKSREKAVSL